MSEPVTPAPSPEELQRVELGLASLVEVAAIKIKTDEAAAPARRAAIRYLASVRCHYFPEAEAALIAALRADRNEAVRLEAVQALAGGCCCTIKTMEALLLAASGSERDGNPAETSDRVKGHANQALQGYAARGMPVPHPEALPPGAKQATLKELQLTSFTTPGGAVAPAASLITEAERRFAETAGTECPSASRSRWKAKQDAPPATKKEAAAAPAAADLQIVTLAERRFAESAGTESPLASRIRLQTKNDGPAATPLATVQAFEPLPALRLAPIGVIPGRTEN